MQLLQWGLGDYEEIQRNFLKSHTLMGVSVTQVYVYVQLFFFKTTDLWLHCIKFYCTKNKKHLPTHRYLVSLFTTTCLVSYHLNVRWSSGSEGFQHKVKGGLLPCKSLWQFSKAVEWIKVWAFAISCQRFAVKFNPINGFTTWLI